MIGSYEDILAMKAKSLSLAPDNGTVDTSDIPLSEPGTPRWPVAEHDRFAPVASWCFHKGWKRGYDAAVKEMQEAFNALAAKNAAMTVAKSPQEAGVLVT